MSYLIKKIFIHKHLKKFDSCQCHKHLGTIYNYENISKFEVRIQLSDKKCLQLNENL